MNAFVASLYPNTLATVPLQGLYLGLGLHRLGTAKRPFIYANFLSSLDGRIAVHDHSSPDGHVPSCMTSTSDFRLLQELEAQADCVVTHGGYLRAFAAKRLGNILQVGQRPDSRDLSDWRAAEGMAKQPTIVIASASLDFPMPDFLLTHEQPCYIVTGASADPKRISYWENRGFKVIIAGRDHGVEGGPLAKALGELGLRCIYLSAGPWMLSTMMRDGQLSRLFHTTAHRVIGGDQPLTMSMGPLFGEHQGQLKLISLYYDSASPEGAGQLFAQYDVPHHQSDSSND